MPKVTKNNLDIGKNIDNNEWNIENKLNFMINDCIKIENNIEKINKLNENIQKCNSNKNEIIFLPEEKGINDFLEKIKTFGSINKIKKLKVKFLKEVLENEELDTKCKFIIIDNIRIKNIGRETLKNLCFVRDEKESSKDFIISQSKSINIYKLAFIGEEFSPGKIESHSITLSINNPKVDQTYNMYLYVRENENGENLSKPLKIVYKIKKDEEDVVFTIFNELETEYNLSCILEKEEIIAKIIELKCDKEKINAWIDEVM